MAGNAVALSGPGGMERLGSISAFIFHNNVYKKYCNIKKMIMKYRKFRNFMCYFKTTFKVKKTRFVRRAKKRAVH